MNWITLLRLLVVKYTKREKAHGTAEEKRGGIRASHQEKEVKKGIREQDIEIGRRHQDRWRKIVKITPESEKHTERWRWLQGKKDCLGDTLVSSSEAVWEKGESFDRAVVIQLNWRRSFLIFIPVCVSDICWCAQKATGARSDHKLPIFQKCTRVSDWVCVHECI